MERADAVNFFIKKAVREGVIDEDIAEKLYYFADWMDFIEEIRRYNYEQHTNSTSCIYSEEGPKGI